MRKRASASKFGIAVGLIVMYFLIGMHLMAYLPE